MRKPVIVTKLKVTQFNAIKTLAVSVYESMLLNPNFVSPQPTLSVLQLATTDLTIALEKWGATGHRGSHADYTNLKHSAMALHKILTQLAAWCMSSMPADLDYPAQAAILVTAGYPLKSEGAPQGRLEMVQNLHRFIHRTITQGQVKLLWKKPLNVTTRSNVKSYLVYRSASNVFSAASVIASVTQTTFTEAPAPGQWYYWVVAVNSNGNGVEGTPLPVEVFKNSMFQP